MKKVIIYQIILSYISKTLLFLIFWETAKNVKHSNFQEINDSYFLVTDKNEMLSCVEPICTEKQSMTNFKICGFGNTDTDTDLLFIV